MPLIDLPLADLQTYTGRNPRADDFDDYWRRALDELDHCPPEPEFQPHSFVPTVEAASVYFTGVKGARIHAKHIRPRGDGPFPTLLLFHGYGGRSDEFFSLLAWAAAGFATFAMDVRGQAGRSQDRDLVDGPTMGQFFLRGIEDHPDRLFYRSVYLDTVQLARVALAQPFVDGRRLGATGWSQGGGLTVACAALEPRVKKLAPVYPFLSDFQRVWEMDLAKDAYKELRDHFRNFDPLHEREAELFTKLGYLDIQHLAPRIQGETLMTVGLMDTITPPSTVYAAYNKIQAKKRIVVYPDHGHEGLPGAHDRIIRFLSE